MRKAHFPEPDDHAQRPSKSQRKRDMHALQALGERLVALRDGQLARVPLEDGLREAIEHAQTITSHEGRRRQMQYIGKLMRQVDAGPIERALEQLTDGSRQATALQHAAEHWRERLLADPARLSEWPTALEESQLVRFQAAIDAAVHEVATHPHGRCYRELFRLIRDTLAAADQASVARARRDEEDHD